MIVDAPSRGVINALGRPCPHGWTRSRQNVRIPAFELLLAEASGCRCADRVLIVSRRFVLDAAVDGLAGRMDSHIILVDVFVRRLESLALTVSETSLPAKIFELFA